MRLKVAAAVAAALCAVSLPVCAALGNTIIAKYMKDKVRSDGGEGGRLLGVDNSVFV